MVRKGIIKTNQGKFNTDNRYIYFSHERVELKGAKSSYHITGRGIGLLTTSLLTEKCHTHNHIRSLFRKVVFEQMPNIVILWVRTFSLNVKHNFPHDA